MGRYLVTCCLAVLLILVQFDLSLSRKLRGRGRSWSSSSSISSKGWKPGRSAEPHYVIQHTRSEIQLNPLSSRSPGQNPPSSLLKLLPTQLGYGGGGRSSDRYESKQWNPKLPKPKMKHVAAVGARGGYALGSALSNMRFRFKNDAEKRWWYENRNRYSDRVYYPKDDQPISKDVFVRDCVNITVKEYIEPTGNQTEDEMETRVVTRVVHKMCKKQYRRLQSSDAEGGNSRRPENTPEGLTPMELETKPLPGAPVLGMALETAGGDPLSDMLLHINSFDQPWPEKRRIEQYRLQSSEAEGGNSKRPLWSGVAGILACVSVSLFILTLVSCFGKH